MSRAGLHGVGQLNETFTAIRYAIGELKPGIDNALFVVVLACSALVQPTLTVSYRRMHPRNDVLTLSVSADQLAGSLNQLPNLPSACPRPISPPAKATVALFC
jgi:hypothetical protein